MTNFYLLQLCSRLYGTVWAPVRSLPKFLCEVCRDAGTATRFQSLDNLWTGAEFWSKVSELAPLPQFDAGVRSNSHGLLAPSGPLVAQLSR